MSIARTAAALCLLGAISSLSQELASAAPITGNPTFLLPNDATNAPYNFSSARPVANGYALSAMYHDSEGAQVWNQTGAVLSSLPGLLSWGIVPDSYCELSADAAALEAKAYHKAQTDGSLNQYSYGASQAWNWYVLAGDPGEVTLTADILIQGVIYANNGDGGNAGTIFGVQVGVLSSPGDLTQDYATSFTGAVNWDAGFARENTVDEDVLWAIGDSSHELNYIVRSQPFTVTVGVPFRVSLTVSAQGFAGPGAWGEAWSDLYDPSLVTSQDYAGIPELTPDGLAVALPGGQYASLGAAGYSVDIVPEPAAGTLLLSALLCLVGLGMKVRSR
jgi:hypothetical protein